MVSQIIHYIRQKNVPLKNALIIAFLISSTIASATDYYISSSGNDANNGLSSSTPWKTIAKVNSSFSTLKPGDRILFNRGGTFYGTIIVTKSGSAGSPITIGAYGTGNKPIITGFTTISGWTNEGNGIYSKVITAESQTNMVTIDGVNTGMGRYPKSTYLIYESFSTNTSITDNELGNATNWTGAEAIIRKNDWTLDRCSITNHSGNTLTYASLGTNQNATANYGYFIQNDLRCVTSYGNWYHNTGIGKFYMYFGTVDPATKSIKVSTINNLIYNNAGNDYITIDNISFEGANENSIFFNYYADNLTIQNCVINFSGNDGIHLEANCSNAVVYNNYINNSSRAGISISQGGKNNITNNTIRNSGLIGGVANIGTWCDGIYITGQVGGLVQFNNIDSSGCNGIYFIGNGIEIRNNLINHSTLLLDDGAGIYTSSVGYNGRIIDGNIVLNALGNASGTTSSSPIARGIYLDDYCANVIVTNNTVAGCTETGIQIHYGSHNTITNNTSYNNGIQIFYQGDAFGSIHDNTVNNNIFFSKTDLQFALRFTTLANDINNFGTADNNYYARPINDGDVFFTYEPSTGYISRTLAGWQSFTNQDANSHKSPIAVTDINNIRFEYNELKTNKVITLDKPMIDVLGAKYVSSITLLPFTSVVLMVDPIPAQPVIPVYTGSVIGNTTPSLLEMTYNVSLANIVPAASVFTVKVNSVIRSITSVAISGTKVQLILASPVVNGNLVTVAYAMPSANPLQTTSGGQAATISAQPVVNNCINAANTPPVITISNPLKGDKYKTNSTIALEAIAFDPDGSISKVEFYSGSIKLVELTSAPYIYTWKDVAAGSYLITAIATDNSNSTTTSAPIEFDVGSNIKYDANSEIINLYPNPNDGHFSIEFITPLQNEKSEILITDLAGKQVYAGPVLKEETLKQFDLSNIKSGIYVMMIITKELLVTKKIIIN